MSIYQGLHSGSTLPGHPSGSGSAPGVVICQASPKMSMLLFMLDMQTLGQAMEGGFFHSAPGAGETAVAKELGGRSRDSYQLAQDARAAANAAALNACNHSISNRFKVLPAAPGPELHACSEEASWSPVMHPGPLFAAASNGRAALGARKLHPGNLQH